MGQTLGADVALKDRFVFANAGLMQAFGVATPAPQTCLCWEGAMGLGMGPLE